MSVHFSRVDQNNSAAQALAEQALNFATKDLSLSRSPALHWIAHDPRGSIELEGDSLGFTDLDGIYLRASLIPEQIKAVVLHECQHWRQLLDDPRRKWRYHDHDRGALEREALHYERAALVRFVAWMRAQQQLTHSGDRSQRLSLARARLGG